MIRRTLIALAAMFALSSAVGCGGSVTALEICNANCDNDKKCGRKNDTETQNCHKDCSDNAGILAQTDIDLNNRCSNASSILQAELSCLSNSDACSGLQPGVCQATARANCVQK